METRIALIGIIVEDFNSSEKINDLLHEYRQAIIGRMGIPYARRDVGVISVVLDAPPNTISALSGKLGMLHGVNTKTIHANVFGNTDEASD